MEKILNTIKTAKVVCSEKIKTNEEISEIHKCFELGDRMWANPKVNIYAEFARKYVITHEVIIPLYYIFNKILPVVSLRQVALQLNRFHIKSKVIASYREVFTFLCKYENKNVRELFEYYVYDPFLLDDLWNQFLTQSCADFADQIKELKLTQLLQLFQHLNIEILLTGINHMSMKQIEEDVEIISASNDVDLEYLLQLAEETLLFFDRLFLDKSETEEINILFENKIVKSIYKESKRVPPKLKSCERIEEKDFDVLNEIINHTRVKDLYSLVAEIDLMVAGKDGKGVKFSAMYAALTDIGFISVNLKKYWRVLAEIYGECKIGEYSGLHGEDHYKSKDIKPFFSLKSKYMNELKKHKRIDK